MAPTERTCEHCQEPLPAGSHRSRRFCLGRKCQEAAEYRKKGKARHARYYAQHKEKMRAYARVWQQEHPERMKIYVQRYLAKPKARKAALARAG